MPKIKLISDSTCDLSPDLIRKHDIEIVPLYVTIGETQYRDGVDLNVDAMYEKVKSTGIMPKTSATAPGDFFTVFEKYLAKGYEIIALGIGSNLSATFKSMNIAKDLLNTDKIHLIDSKNLSSGSGLLLLKAAKFRAAGDSASVIAEKIQALVPNVRTQFVISTMDYLYKGGRCSGMAALFGTLLKVKPIIKVVDGTLIVGKKPRGNIHIALDLLIEEVKQVKDRLDPDFLMITHSKALESATYIRKALMNQLPVKQLYETPAGCVISSHCGEGCIGILYIVSDESPDLRAA